MRRERCGSCRYWQPKTSATGMEGAECRRRPPHVVAAGRETPWRGGSDVRSRWPQTSAADWCGEFEPRRCPGEGEGETTG